MVTAGKSACAGSRLLVSSRNRARHAYCIARLQVRTPQKSGLEALWARAGQAGHLRLEVESVRVAEQERSLAEARQQLEEWDHLVSSPPFTCPASLHK